MAQGVGSGSNEENKAIIWGNTNIYVACGKGSSLEEKEAGRPGRENL